MVKDQTCPHPCLGKSPRWHHNWSMLLSLHHVDRENSSTSGNTQKVVRQEEGDEQGERRKQSTYLFRDTGWSCEPFLPTLPLAVGAHKSSILMSTQERNGITSGLEEGMFRILVQGGQSAGVSSLSHENANHFHFRSETSMHFQNILTSECL